MKKFFQYLILLSIVLINLPAYAFDEERITNFESKINILKDGTLEIQEDITVVVQNDKFNYGIYRDFKTNKQPANLKYQEYTVESAQINNKPIDFSTDSQDFLYRVKIGDKYNKLTPGTYTFTLKYKVFNSEGYFKDHDEIFWNLIGEYPVKIEKVSGYIKYPDEYDSKEVKVSGFQGPVNSKEKFSNYRIEGKYIYFESKRILNPKENISLGVWFKKGFFNKNENPNFYLYYDYIKYGVIIFLNLFSLLVVFFIFKNNNADEKIQNAPVTYDIPNDIPPSIFLYLFKYNTYGRGLSSELINLAINKIIKIEKIEDTSKFFKQNNFKITLLDKNLANTEFQKKLLETLFPSGFEFLISNETKSQECLFNAQQVIANNANEQKLFLGFTNGAGSIKFFYPFLLYVLLIALSALTLQEQYNELNKIFVLSGITLTIATILYKPLTRYYKMRENFTSIFSIFIFILLILGSFYLLVPDENFKYLILSSFIPFFIYEFINSFDYLTDEGISLMTIVLGFRKFALSQKNYNYVVEKEIPLTLNMYEKYLPYALALGVETQWSNKFNAVIQSVNDPKYKDEYFYIYNISTFDNSISSQLVSYNSSAFGTSYTSSSSSSSGGFSSGSSSGGGGGSAGGGGW